MNFKKILKSTYFLVDLQTASPETPVRGSERLLAESERDWQTGISL